MAKSLAQLRKGRDFVRYAEAHGATVRNGKGSHYVITTDKGGCAVPCHKQDIGKGLRSKIVKTFILIGLAWAVVAMLPTL